MPWEPTVTAGDWGRFQIVINDVDVTFFRGVPTQVKGYSYADPFSDSLATVHLPQVSPFDPLGRGDLWWLWDFCDIDINLIRPDGTKLTLWEGLVPSIEDSLDESGRGITLRAIGALYQLDFYVRTPQHITKEQAVRYEWAIASQFTPPSDRHHLRTASCQVQYPADMSNTPWLTSYSGAFEKVLTGYIQRLLADMQHPDGRRWTLLKNPGRIPVLKIRDTTTINWTVTAGAPGVSYSLKRDLGQAPNVIYGEGTDEAGTSWRNTTVDVASDGSSKVTQWPIGWHAGTHPVDAATNPEGHGGTEPVAYDTGLVRVESLQRYGAGVALVDARTSARQQIGREADPGWFGTLTLQSDPEEGSRYEIRADQNIRLRHFRGYGTTPIEAFNAEYAIGIFTVNQPEGEITRGQFASVLKRTLDYIDNGALDDSSPPPATADYFTDDNGHIHEPSINRLAEQNIAVGYPDGTFKPDDPCLRGQMAAFVRRAAEWVTATTMATSPRDFFTDDDASQYEADINKAANAGILTGYDYILFGPDNVVTRQQAATVMQKLIRYAGGTLLGDKEGIVCHIAEASHDVESGTTTLTVDTKARDLLTLAQIIERNKSENQNPAKMLMVNRSSALTEDTKPPWDYHQGSGMIPKAATADLLAKRKPSTAGYRPSDKPANFVFVNGAHGDPYKRWKVVPVVASGKGSIIKSEIRAYNADGTAKAIPFHAGIYSDYVTEYDMPPDPFAAGAWTPSEVDPLGGYAPSAVVLWGQQDQRAGYWPGTESEADPATGILIDEGTWQYQLPEGEVTLWLALYATVDVYFQGRLYHGVQ